MAIIAIILFILVNLGFLVYGQGCTGSFLSPGPVVNDNDTPANNPVYTIGRSLTVTWNTTCPEVSLVIWQNLPNVELKFLPDSQRLSNAQSYTWNPIGIDGFNDQPLYNLSLTQVFFFQLFVPGDQGPFAQSSFFNLTNPNATTTSSSSTSTITSATSTATTATSPHTITNAPSLSSSSKTGIGIGLGLGIPLLCTFAIISILALRKRRKGNIPPPAEWKPARDTLSDSSQTGVKLSTMYPSPEARYSALNPTERWSTPTAAAELPGE